VLHQDQGLQRLLGNSLPSGVTLSNFLRSFNRQTLRAVTRINHWFARQLIKRLGLTKLTIDVDATLIESHKQEAKKTYKGFRGYDPLIASVARYRIIITGLFRPGNAAPAGNAVSFLKRILRIIPPELKIRIRSDSAWYNAYVMDHADDHGVQFAITADMDESTKATIQTIPEEDWD
jgi:hypothetical protein